MPRSQPQVRLHARYICAGREDLRTIPCLQADLAPTRGALVSDELRISTPYHHHGSVSTTPLWVPLAVAGMGILGTLAAGVAGGLLTQRWADRRDDKTWALERAREEKRWRREDEARTFEHRREVFEDFYEGVKALACTAYDHGYGFTDSPELPGDWHADAAGKLNRLALYADRRVAAAASGRLWSCMVLGAEHKIRRPGRSGVLRAPTTVRRC